MTIISIAALAAVSLYAYRNHTDPGRINGIREVLGLFFAIVTGLWGVIDALQGHVRPGGSLRRPGIQVASDVAE
jgi:hypothetical protein